MFIREKKKETIGKNAVKKNDLHFMYLRLISLSLISSFFKYFFKFKKFKISQKGKNNLWREKWNKSLQNESKTPISISYHYYQTGFSHSFWSAIPSSSTTILGIYSILITITRKKALLFDYSILFVEISK